MSTHRGTLGPPAGDQRGFALFTVIVFAFLILITGMAFFAMASYETKAAIYREDSSEAFYLADAGIELARSEILNEGTWRGPVPETALGAGTFTVQVVDSIYPATGDSAIHVYSEGHVRRSDRAVEAWLDAVPPEYALALLVMEDIFVRGNLCVEGHLHANGDADFGPADVMLTCDGTYSENFVILPPAIYTEPEYYPNSTYYYVRGLYVPGSTEKKKSKADLIEARIFDRYDNDITESMPFIISAETNLLDYDLDSATFIFDLDGNISGVPTVDYLFGDNSPYFALDTAAGHTSVVVNFGTYLGSTPTRSRIELKSTDASGSVRATLINSRYIGTPGGDRLDWRNWDGGMTYLATKLTFEPRSGIALITHYLDQANALVQIGTEANPALLYVTRDVDDVQGQLTVTGSVVVLGNWINQGGPGVSWNPGFIPLLPPFLEGFPFGGVSGITELLDWREVAVR